MKHSWIPMALLMFAAGCRTVPEPCGHTVVITAVDSATGDSIPLSVTAAGASTVAITHTNEVLEAELRSPGYRSAVLTLEHGFSGPVTVIMEKEGSPNNRLDATD
jgi:hypothetical protein